MIKLILALPAIFTLLMNNLIADPTPSSKPLTKEDYIFSVKKIFKVDMTLNKKTIEARIVPVQELDLNKVKITVKYGDQDPLILKPKNGKFGYSLTLDQLYQIDNHLTTFDFEVFRNDEVIDSGLISYNYFYETDENFKSMVDAEVQKREKKYKKYCRDNYHEKLVTWNKNNQFTQSLIQGEIEKSCFRKNKNSEEKEKTCVKDFHDCADFYRTHE